MAEHTPTPWEHTEGDIWVDTREQVCCGRGYNECCGEPDVRGGQDLIAQSNPVDAAFIIKAVNNYDALVKTLEECQSALAMMIEPETIRETSTLHAWSHAVAAERKARATLAAVGTPGERS